MKVYRTGLLPILSLLALIILSACDSREPPVRVATHVWPGYEFLHLGSQLGYLPQHQIKLIDSPSATQSLRLLHENKADAATLTLDEVLLGRRQGLELTIILIMDISVGADMILARPPVTTVADLRGATIAVEDNGVGKLLLTEALKQAGISLLDIDIIPASADQHLSLWKKGLSDAIVSYEPSASAIRQHGGEVIFDSSQVPATIVDVLAVRSETLQGNKTLWQQLVNGFFRTQQYFLSNPQDAAYRMAGRLKVSGLDVMPLFSGLELPDRLRNQKLLARDNPQLRRVARNIDELMGADHDDSSYDFNQLFLDQFLQ